MRRRSGRSLPPAHLSTFSHCTALSNNYRIVVLQCVAVCCSVLQCVAVCCSDSLTTALPRWLLSSLVRSLPPSGMIHICTGWQRCIGCLIFISHFLQKSPMNNGSLAERDLHKASNASSPPFIYTLDIQHFISVLDGIVICSELYTNPYTNYFPLRLCTSHPNVPNPKSKCKQRHSSHRGIYMLRTPQYSTSPFSVITSIGVAPTTHIILTEDLNVMNSIVLHELSECHHLHGCRNHNTHRRSKCHGLHSTA